MPELEKGIRTYQTILYEKGLAPESADALGICCIEQGLSFSTYLSCIRLSRPKPPVQIPADDLIDIWGLPRKSETNCHKKWRYWAEASFSDDHKPCITILVAPSRNGEYSQASAIYHLSDGKWQTRRKVRGNKWETRIGVFSPYEVLFWLLEAL